MACSLALLAPVPNSNDHHHPVVARHRVAEDVGSATERHDQLAEVGTSRPSAVGEVAQRAIGAFNLVEKTIGGARILGCEESPQPLDIALGASGEDDLQSLRASGRGKGLSVL